MGTLLSPEGRMLWEGAREETEQTPGVAKIGKETPADPRPEQLGEDRKGRGISSPRC